MDIIAIASIALTGTFLSLSLKIEVPVFAACISLISGVVIFFYVSDGIAMVAESLNRMTEESGINKNYMAMVMRIAAISYICGFVADICADAGEKAAADKVELAGRVAIAVISAPVMLSLMEAVTKYL